MSYLVINGGKKLSGSVENQSAKNAALYLLYAGIMIKGVSGFTDVPEIEEVERTLELLSSLGVKIKKTGKGKISLDAEGKLNLANIDKKACEGTRASLFLMGALAAREKSFKLYKSGGCKLGNRTTRPHVLALEKLGVNVDSKEKYYEIHNEALHAARIVMYESGDTATGNAVMAAVLAQGKTIIKMASANYMVQDLCYFLSRAGAKIGGIGTTTLEIEGVSELQPVSDYPVMPDPIVAMTYISAAITTDSHLTVKNCPLEFLDLELCKLEVMGQKYKINNRRQSKNGKFEIGDIEIIPGELIALPDKIECRPFPGLNIDNLPLFIPILAKAKGRTLVHDWVYEDRAIYSLELKKLGANIILIDTHRVWVEGPTKFKANEVICPPALRPAANVLIAMLAAPGRSVLRNTYVIDRGYENLYETLNKAGADIKIVME